MILFITRIPPDSLGHGGSQRAMNLLRALSKIGPVDTMLVHRKCDRDSEESFTREPNLYSRSYFKVSVPDWDTSHQRWPFLSYRKALIADSVSGYCADAPHFRRRTVDRLAQMLAVRRYDVVFAGRLPCAVIADQMLHAGAISARHKVVDFDDILSRMGSRMLHSEGEFQGRLWKLSKRVDCARIRVAERRVLRRWDAVSVCSDDDVKVLHGSEPSANIVRVPNVVDRRRLPSTLSSEPRFLFVGSLSHGPNVQGLRLFLAQSWPIVRAALPNATLKVVGMFPFEGLDEEVSAAGAELHVSVPDVEPYYSDCDVVVCPIFYGGGTRIKILEAMGYGRAIVSTTIGAEGLDIETERHALIVDDLVGMANACIRLARDRELRIRLENAAADLQRSEFSAVSFEAAVRSMVMAQADVISRTAVALRRLPASSPLSNSSVEAM